MRKFKPTAGLLVAIIGVSIPIGACGGTESASSGEQNGTATATATKTSTPEPTPTPKPDVSINVSDRTVYSDNVTLSGKVRPAKAKVRIDGKRVSVSKSGRFSLPVTVSHGGNDFGIKASAKGFRASATAATITRRLSSAEKAAAEAQRAAEFKASATTVDYDQLAKDPYDYAGTKVVYRGQIFQIGEDYTGTWMLLSVTDDGYGFWDDNIWVRYPGEIEGAEDDIITVYGTVTGEKSYDTQAGGATYVPKIKAKYIDE